MTGPEHYREAENLLQLALDAGSERGDQEDLGFLAEAQVHATLALAAAKALEVTATLPPHATQAAADWREVITPVERATS